MFTKQILTWKDPTPKPGKRKKSEKFLTWFLDLLTRLAHPGSVGPQFFSAESFSPKSIYPESETKKFENIFFVDTPHTFTT
jgi:hypothetical protein